MSGIRQNNRYLLSFPLLIDPATVLWRDVQVAHYVTIALPDRVYQRLREIAEASGQGLESVLLRTIEEGMPPDVDRVRPQYRDGLLALHKLSDQQLMDMVMNPLEEHKGEQKKSDWETLQRAYASRLLKWRGHPIPTPYEISLDEK